jgi:tight adherence protein B
MTAAVLLLTALVFLVMLGLCVSALYLVVERPAAKRRFEARLTSMHRSLGPGGPGGVLLMRDDVLSDIPLLNRLLQRLPPVVKLQMLLAQAGMSTPAGTLLMTCFSIALLALLLGLVIQMPFLFLLMLTAAAGAAPLAVVLARRQRRFARFEEMFPDAIDLLARAVRAGHAFTTGFELIANETPDPLASEFRIAYEQQNLGMPLREALENLAARVPLPDVWFFVSALQIQRESGGNLAEILDKLSYVIRERFKILRQVKVFTAEARMSMYILTAVPPISALMMYFVNREYIMTLFQDPLGHRMVATAVFLQVTGYFVMRQITRLKV